MRVREREEKKKKKKKKKKKETESDTETEKESGKEIRCKQGISRTSWQTAKKVHCYRYIKYEKCSSKSSGHSD